MAIDLKEAGAALADRFRGLDGRHPGQWPLAPRILCALCMVLAVSVLCLLYTSPSPRDLSTSRMPSSA